MKTPTEKKIDELKKQARELVKNDDTWSQGIELWMEAIELELITSKTETMKVKK